MKTPTASTIVEVIRILKSLSWGKLGCLFKAGLEEEHIITLFFELLLNVV